MTKGMRFQTKLMLTLGGMIIAVTVALIWATGAKVRQAYTRQFSEKFESLVGQIEASRAERSGDFLTLSATLAKHPFVIAKLQGKESIDEKTTEDFWRIFSESFRGDSASGEPKIRTGRGPLPPDLLSRIGRVSVVDVEGEETLLQHPKIPKGRGQQMKQISFKKRGSQERLKQFLSENKQQTFFQPATHQRPGQKKLDLIRETVATPVTDPDSGEVIGALMRSASGQTEAERFLQRYQSEFETGTPLLAGMLLDGELYSPSFDEATGDALLSAIEERIVLASGRKEHQHMQFEAAATGSAYLIHVDELTSESALRPAYQVAAFPLAQLEADLAELRIRGTGIGAGVLVLGLVICWILARNLSTPLQDLARGTEEIRAGNLDHRVHISSGDEVGELALSFNEMAEELKQKALYRELLGKVSDESVAQALVSGTLDLELGGELKEVSVLFCDIRGFTSMTENMPPTEVIEMLNEHMTAMTEVVRSCYGVVDKFVGDEIMAVFGALKSYGDDAGLAARCALEMVRKRAELNEANGTEIHIGIGVATGEAVAGCMGSNDRLNYTVLGARVNLAARLCSAAGAMEVVIDDKTFASVQEEATATPMENLALKGFANAVAAYRLDAVVEREEPSSLNPVAPST